MNKLVTGAVIGCVLTFAYNVKWQKEENDRNKKIVYNHPATTKMINLEKQVNKLEQSLLEQTKLTRFRDEQSSKLLVNNAHTYCKYFNRCVSQLGNRLDLHMYCGTSEKTKPLTIENICDAYAKQHYANDTDHDFTNCTLGIFLRSSF